jgi:transcriptional regulator with XRE-family HTH domain
MKASTIIGINVRVLRAREFLTLDLLSAETKIERNRINRIEHGKARVTVEELLAFCRYFKRPIEYFLKDQLKSLGVLTCVIYSFLRHYQYLLL